MVLLHVRSLERILQAELELRSELEKEMQDVQEAYEMASKTSSKNMTPVPIGLFSIVQVTNVQFVTLRAKPTKKRPNPAVAYRRKERMLAWRPREFHEFWSRFVNGSDV